MEIRIAPSQDITPALSLVERVFLQFEAPDYAPEGIETFLAFLHTPSEIEALTLYCAYEKEDIVGVIATRGNSHIALFFVDAAHQQQGIGRALFQAATSTCKSDLMTVNSSPFAVEIYRKLGFEPISAEQCRDGIRFTPMKCVLQKEQAT